MKPFPEEIYSAATVRDIDRCAIDEKGIPGYTLMTRAASAALTAARERFPAARRWQVVCGAGNNAGDGYVVARLAASEGIDVTVVTVTDPEKLGGDAAIAHADFVAAGGEVEPWQGRLDEAASLLVDALLGSGLDRDLGGPYAEAVAAINQSGTPVMALDVPSGLDADTGAARGSAVLAALTVTFVGLKTGLFLGRGPECCGELQFAGLDIDPACYHGRPVEMHRIPDAPLTGLLSQRSKQAHKGNFGHVLLVGGGTGMPGAVILAGEAALRAGAGRVSVATDRQHAAVIANERPELMVRGVTRAEVLEPMLANCDVVAAGPGLGQSPWANGLMHALANQTLPSVWDADALNWLAEHPGEAARRIITPHPGEAATLLGITSAEVQADRRAAVNELQRRYGGVAVLKGAGTLVKGADAVTWVSTAGNPGMAAPGMGDVLTGVIAAFLAQGLSPIDAARAGVEIHAQAGDLAAASGERGTIASDVIDRLRQKVNP